MFSEQEWLSFLVVHLSVALALFLWMDTSSLGKGHQDKEYGETAILPFSFFLSVDDIIPVRSPFLWLCAGNPPGTIYPLLLTSRLVYVPSGQGGSTGGGDGEACEGS